MIRIEGETISKTATWLPIPSIPGCQASSMGDILSPSGKLLKQRYSNGQMRVRVRGRWYTVWKLVLEAFAGIPVGPGYRPWHLNGDLFDNRYENLVYRGSPRTELPPPRIELCSRGHELTGDNVKTWGKNNRICVKCDDQRSKQGSGYSRR